MTRELNSLIVYGHAGTGKTTAVAKAMPNALWVVTRKSNLSGYHSFLRKEPEKAQELGLRPIPEKRIVQVPSARVNPESGAIESTSTKDFLARLLQSYCANVVSGKLDVDGIVLDEFSVFAKRVYAEIRASNSNGFQAIDEFKRWTAEVCEIPVATDKPMCLVCHAQDPKFDEGSSKPKYKGGPAMPIGTVVADICALPDAVLQLEVRERGLSGEVERVLRTEAHPEWERKCRQWGIPSEMPPDLRGLLQQAGWTYDSAAE